MSVQGQECYRHQKEATVRMSVSCVYIYMYTHTLLYEGTERETPPPCTATLSYAYLFMRTQRAFSAHSEYVHAHICVYVRIYV